MEEALRAYLLAATSVAALAAARVDWGLRPQGKVLPAVVLSAPDDRDDIVHDGPSGLVMTRVQIDCWARTAGEAKRLARAIRALLNGKRLETGGRKFVFRLDAARELPDSDTEGTLHRVSLDFRVWHGEA